MPKLIIAGVVTLALAGAGQAQQSPPSAVARFYEFEALHSTLGNFRGATESWRGRIVTVRGRKVIGASYVSCIRIDSTTRNCGASYTLPEGTLVAAGVIGSQNRYSLTITGGTGAYLGYSGWISVVRIGDAPKQVGPNGQLVPLRLSLITFHLSRG